MNDPLPTGARSAPPALRNREPILEVLRRVLPARGSVVEIASGTGEHAVYFARALPSLVWQPSDPDPVARQSIAAHASQAGLANLRPPLDIDAHMPVWPVVSADAIVCINMIHISPWPAAEGLFAHAQKLLPAGGVLFFYGPFREGGIHTAPSNARFDDDLQRRDPRWGVRDLDDVEALAQRTGFSLQERIAMPAHNLSVIFTRQDG